MGGGDIRTVYHPTLGTTMLALAPWAAVLSQVTSWPKQNEGVVLRKTGEFFMLRFG